MLEEKDFELVVSEKSLGSLTTNAKIIKDKVEQSLVNYKADNYTEDTVDEAIKDKAMLNNTAKALNDERIKLEKEFMIPFTEFKDTVKEITDMIKKASSEIDVIVKDVDTKVKAERKQVVTKIYDENVKELKDILPLEKIFDDKWLNKGSFKDDGTFKLEKDLLEKIDNVRKDLITIGDLNSKYEVELKNDYLSNFNLGDVIRKNNDLNQKEELLKVQTTESKEIVKEQQIEKMNEMASKAVEIQEEFSFETYTLKITGTREQMIALKKFLQTNNMNFEKV